MRSDKWKFNRHELAGAFGDLGTLVPLVTAMIIINKVNAKGLFLSFGLLYIYSGLFFGLPVSVQPMKFIATIMITENLSPSYLLGAGLFVGVFYIMLALTNAISLISRITPKAVIKGIQFGLGLNLLLLAMQFMLGDGLFGWILSIVGVAIVLILINGKRLPPALLLLPLGISFSMIYNNFPFGIFTTGIEIGLPQFSVPTVSDITQGALLLAIPQIPLTLSNAILATSELSRDFFGKKKQVSTRRLSISHGFMNLVSVALGGIPVCHGAGGMAGHYRFGARTGGAMIIIGTAFTLLSIFYGDAIYQILSLIPFSILGVLLLFSGIELVKTVKGIIPQKTDFLIALLVGLTTIIFRYGYYGYVIALVGGILLFYIIKNFERFKKRKKPSKEGNIP